MLRAHRPGIIIQGEADEVVTPSAVQKLVDKLRTQKHITIHHDTIPGANHFFADELPLLMKSVDDYLDMRLEPGFLGPLNRPDRDIGDQYDRSDHHQDSALAVILSPPGDVTAEYSRNAASMASASAALAMVCTLLPFHEGLTPCRS